MPTALIVEDEPEANRLLALLVQLRGYQTVSAFLGREALDRVEQSPPDVVFLDLMLPDLSGFDICRTLKRARRTTSIPIVMVTARLASDSRMASFQLGANQFVPKPYTPDQIFEALDRAQAWKHSLEASEAVGAIGLGIRDELGPFADVARFQSLLLTRTSCGEEPAHRLVQGLRTMIRNIQDWGRRAPGIEQMAILAYEIRAGQVVLTVRDQAGWTGSDDLSHEDALGLLLGRGGFDSIAYDQSGDEATLTKRLPDGLVPPRDPI